MLSPGARGARPAGQRRPRRAFAVRGASSELATREQTLGWRLDSRQGGNFVRHGHHRLPPDRPASPSSSAEPDRRRLRRFHHRPSAAPPAGRSGGERGPDAEAELIAIDAEEVAQPPGPLRVGRQRHARPLASGDRATLSRRPERWTARPPPCAGSRRRPTRSGRASPRRPNRSPWPTRPCCIRPRDRLPAATAPIRTASRPPSPPSSAPSIATSRASPPAGSTIPTSPMATGAAGP